MEEQLEINKGDVKAKLQQETHISFFFFNRWYFFHIQSQVRFSTLPQFLSKQLFSATRMRKKKKEEHFVYGGILSQIFGTDGIRTRDAQLRQKIVFRNRIVRRCRNKKSTSLGPERHKELKTECFFSCGGKNKKKEERNQSAERMKDLRAQLKQILESGRQRESESESEREREREKKWERGGKRKKISGERKEGSDVWRKILLTLTFILSLSHSLFFNPSHSVSLLSQRLCVLEVELVKIPCLFFLSLSRKVSFSSSLFLFFTFLPNVQCLSQAASLNQVPCSSFFQWISLFKALVLKKKVKSDLVLSSTPLSLSLSLTFSLRRSSLTPPTPLSLFFENIKRLIWRSAPLLFAFNDNFPSFFLKDVIIGWVDWSNIAPLNRPPVYRSFHFCDRSCSIFEYHFYFHVNVDLLFHPAVAHSSLG